MQTIQILKELIDLDYNNEEQKFKTSFSICLYGDLFLSIKQEIVQIFNIKPSDLGRNIVVFIVKCLSVHELIESGYFDVIFSLMLKSIEKSPSVLTVLKNLI